MESNVLSRLDLPGLFIPKHSIFTLKVVGLKVNFIRGLGYLS